MISARVCGSTSSRPEQSVETSNLVVASQCHASWFLFRRVPPPTPAHTQKTVGSLPYEQKGKKQKSDSVHFPFKKNKIFKNIKKGPFTYYFLPFPFSPSLHHQTTDSVTSPLSLPPFYLSLSLFPSLPLSLSPLSPTPSLHHSLPLSLSLLPSLASPFLLLFALPSPSGEGARKGGGGEREGETYAGKDLVCKLHRLGIARHLLCCCRPCSCGRGRERGGRGWGGGERERERDWQPFSCSRLCVCVLSIYVHVSCLCIRSVHQRGAAYVCVKYLCACIFFIY